MDQEAFLAEVGRRLNLTHGRAEQLTTTVLQVLRERIGPQEAADLDAQLPAGLKRDWREPAPEQAIRFDKDEFFRRIAVLTDIPEADVARSVKAVFKTLQRALKSPTGEEGEAWDVMSRLPKDLKKLWTAAARMSDRPARRKETGPSPAP